MEQELEIEYKVLLSEDKFKELLNNLNFPSNPVTQINYYFETPDLKLKQINSALRIREKNSHYIVTLKEPHKKGILETHDKISEDTFQQAIKNNILFAPNCSKQLQMQNISLDTIKYIGSLTTERYEFKENNLIYVLDKSFYNNKVDYELEIEAPSQEIGSHIFNQLISRFDIKKIPPITKIERFVNTL